MNIIRSSQFGMMNIIRSSQFGMLFISSVYKGTTKIRKVDRRHGKRPLPSEASEEKEKEKEQLHFPSSAAYESSWSETELSAMVSALTQVIGTADDNPAHVNMVQSNPSPLFSDHSAVKQEPDPSQPVQGQATCSIVKVGSKSTS
ncbi:hypothetical protein FNV43_RR25634 [Rhamnella rubrinervis]|uniref:Uncharacterized protein n=1 Tax=Rhamnella rubrinervis TaxID=2594499 RepID=A0A8K0DMJ2_9ROSA|nr:hypothetical protein FNV43_RR25634 [Rhamnella rubrinervis]